jgi:hypothetical protein
MFRVGRPGPPSYLWLFERTATVFKSDCNVKSYHLFPLKRPRAHRILWAGLAFLRCLTREGRKPAYL